MSPAGGDLLTGGQCGEEVAAPLPSGAGAGGGGRGCPAEGRRGQGGGRALRRHVEQPGPPLSFP